MALIKSCINNIHNASNCCQCEWDTCAKLFIVIFVINRKSFINNKPMHSAFSKKEIDFGDDYKR